MSGAAMASADGSQTGIFPASTALLDLVQRPRRRQPFMAVEDDVAELVHGQDRHGVGGDVGKAHALLRLAHLIGERAAARHDDERQAGCASAAIHTPISASWAVLPPSLTTARLTR